MRVDSSHREVMVRLWSITAVLVVAVIVGGCGGDGGGISPSSTTAGQTSTLPATSSTVDDATTATTAGPLETAWVQDVPYFVEIEGLSRPLLDVFAPVAEGPWPMVVTFHPDSSMNNKTAMTNLAMRIAEHGAVVVNATYGGSGLTPGRSADVYRASVDQGTCAVWFAIENAAEYGGNPSDIRLVGFSGGANNAAAVALYPSTDDTRCQSTANSFKVSQVVAFEGDLTLSPQWDPVLIDDPSFYNEMTVWSHIYGYSGGQIDILVDDKTTIAITSGVRAYLDLRHPEGSIREAWDELGVIEEDYATLIQANEMFHSQLIAADKASSLTHIEAANHTISTTAEDAIIDLLFASDI